MILLLSETHQPHQPLRIESCQRAAMISVFSNFYFRSNRNQLLEPCAIIFWGIHDCGKARFVASIEIFRLFGFVQWSGCPFQRCLWILRLKESRFVVRVSIPRFLSDIKNTIVMSLLLVYFVPLFRWILKSGDETNCHTTRRKKRSRNIARRCCRRLIERWSWHVRRKRFAFRKMSSLIHVTANVPNVCSMRERVTGDH